MKRIALFLADGFEEIEAITPIDLLRRAQLEIITIGITGAKVRGAHGIEIFADTTEIPSKLDAIIIPGGMPGASNIAASEKAMTAITNLAQEKKLIAAICASPAVVLGPTNILAHKHFTCYPSFESEVINATHTPDPVCVDENIITSKGPGTAAKFALAIIEYLAGHDAAQSVSKQILMEK